MTTFDPDTLAYDPAVLRDIVDRFDGKLALNCEARRQDSIESRGPGRPPMKLLTRRERKGLRESFRPKRIRILFVGEAPPASGRFFYSANSGLYRAMRDAFIAVYPRTNDENFLELFQASGCYLTDLCPKPVDHLNEKLRRRSSESRRRNSFGKTHPASTGEDCACAACDQESRREGGLASKLARSTHRATLPRKMASSST